MVVAMLVVINDDSGAGTRDKDHCLIYFRLFIYWKGGSNKGDGIDDDNGSGGGGFVGYLIELMVAVENISCCGESRSG